MIGLLKLNYNGNTIFRVACEGISTASVHTSPEPELAAGDAAILIWKRNVGEKLSGKGGGCVT